VLFGDGLAQAVTFAALLADDGVRRGVIGPREVPRLWERHLLNSAVVATVCPPGARVLDVGSGAGLPGIPLALARPDLDVVLLEPLQRRCDFLADALASLGLDRVRVHRGRAEDPAVRAALGGSAVVVARAVAPLDRLVGWTLPLVAPGGRLVALKGAGASEELEQAQETLRQLGVAHAAVQVLGEGLLAEPATVVVVRRAAR